MMKTEKITFLVGDTEILHNMPKVPVLPLFSEQVVVFLNELSKKLRGDVRTKSYTDVLSYAFWVRKASIENEKKNHSNSGQRMGRGVSFHIAPSNVPVNFAVSMTSALLAGNACVLRVSNKEFEQVAIICDAIQELLEDTCKDLRNYICIIRYEHDAEITQMLSSMCDIRIIWGGNQTIQLIRQADLPPRAIEMAFPDRYSISIIKSEEYLQSDAETVARDFYTDTYYSDQNACSSPRLICWLGKEVEVARKRFWESLSSLVKQEYTLHPIQVVDKLNAFCLCAANGTGEENPEIKGIMNDNYLYRIEVSTLSKDIMQYKEGGGYFFEYVAEELEEMVPIIGKTCQTVSVLGFSTEEVRELVYQHGVRGVDRIVPIGKTMELSFRWDGYDMIETMSRIVETL